MPETPQKVRAKVDDAILELNLNWDLDLPRVRGSDAEAAEHTSAIAHRCSGRLRYLSFRIDSLDGHLRDFDARARQLYSKWVPKPKQERGTIPILPVLKSNLQRDVKRRRVPGLHLDRGQKDALLELLEKILEHDLGSARSKDGYPVSSIQPSRSPSSPDSAARRHSPRLTITTNDESIPPKTPPTSRTTGKRISDENISEQTPMSKRRRPAGSSKQTKLFDYVKWPSTLISNSNSFSTPPLPALSNAPTVPLGPSFNTAESSSVPEVFDTPLSSNTSSARTSLLSDEGSQDLFPTQEAAELYEDEAIKRSLSSTMSFSIESFADRLQNTFSTVSNLPSGISFENLYELESLSRSWAESPLDIFKQVESISKAAKTARERSDAYKKVKVSGNKPPMEVFGDAWQPSRTSTPGQENHMSTYLNISLEWATKSSDPSVFRIKMRGPTTDKSCRFHRIFGGDRFLTVQIPFIQRGDLPSHLRDRVARLHDEVVNWLTSTEHNIAGRRWRAFWVDDKPLKANKDKAAANRVFFFATRGVGLHGTSSSERPNRSPTSIEEFINLHTPIAHNMTSTNLKLFARFKLGLSKTTPTVVLKQKEFRMVPDKFDGGDILNDGCALMSPSLAIEIGHKLGLRSTPSAFQGRISGAKGLWIVDYNSMQQGDDRWIQVSESQLKVKPHPRERDSCDEYRQFEVSDYSKPSQPSPLNTQFLTVLADRGVRPKILEDCLREHIRHYYYRDLCDAMTDPLHLRLWVQKYHRTPRTGDEVESSGAFPRDRSEKINMMLEAGFSADDCNSPLPDLIGLSIRVYLNWWAEKLKIVVDESTFLYCVPDPYEVLEEGEVHCCISRPWIDPKTGASSYFVAGMDGLVARSPANHPSDIQRVKLVFKSELQSFQDVMVFSTKGKRSLASRLSGGDYDGDQCWLCWRQDIVATFENYGRGPPDHITTEQCGLVPRSKMLSTLMTSADSSLTPFLSSCFDFNLRPPMVGICTNEHEKLVYHTSLQHPGAIQLAALASFLVDARKQGLELTEEAWQEVRKECSGLKHLSKPAFKDENAKVKEDNIIDRLRFRVANVEVEDALKHFHANWERVLAYDPHFASTWKKAWARAKNSKNKVTLSILQKLEQDVRSIDEVWRQLTDGKVDDNPGIHPQSVATCFKMFNRIEPLRTVEEDEIHRRYEDDSERRFSYWSLLRASCFYSKYPQKMISWYMAGEELCFWQAERSGRMRSLVGSMYAVTKIDGRAVRSRMGTSTSMDEPDKTSMGSIGPYLQRRR